MSSGQPLVAADVPPTPSTVTSPSPAPEPEVQAEQKVTIRIKPSLHALYASSRLNKFGTTDKTCTTPGCDWVVEEPWLSGLCVVCEQKQHSDLEKERIQSILRKRAKDESVVSLHFSTAFFPLAHIHPKKRGSLVFSALLHVFLRSIICISCCSTDALSSYSDQLAKCVRELLSFPLLSVQPSTSSALYVNARCSLQIRFLHQL